MMKRLILLLGLMIGISAALPLSAVPVNAARKAAAKAVSAGSMNTAK